MSALTIVRRDGSEHTVLFDDVDSALVLQHRWRIQPSRSGSVLYAITTNGRSTISMHRLLTGRRGTDHVNHDGLDNRRDNLRPATPRENSGNRRPSRGTSSQFRGVTLHRRTGRWQAALNRRYLGLFDSEEAAAAAFDDAALREYGDYAYLNLKAAS